MSTPRPSARPQSSDGSRSSSAASRPSTPSSPATKRGRNSARANSQRNDSRADVRADKQWITGIKNADKATTAKASAGAKANLLASFDTGEAPNLEATFAELGVPASIVRALLDQGIETPFPIQAATMADCLAGRDVLGRGRTGSGKTLAFVLPVLTRLAATPTVRRQGRPRALILVPTRELAIQIHTAMAPFAKLLSLRATTIFGGVGANPQIEALRQGVDIVIACPGRLEDHVRSNYARLDAVEITVLDEADHMADMGFLPVVKKLLDQTPQHSQRLLFSATLDNGIDAIVQRYLHDPILRSVDPVESVEEKMTHHVFAVSEADRFGVLRDLAAAPGRIMVFTRTKHHAKKLARTLVTAGVPTVELQGNLSQNIRTRNLETFRSGRATALVATDIAARGIHIDEVALVVHYDPPVDHKAYLHRSGRTARAGAEGTVITMMLESQTAEVRDLTKKAGIAPTITRVTPLHPVLRQVAPGERKFVEPVVEVPAPLAQTRADVARRPETPRPARRPGPKPASPGNHARSGRPSSGGRPSGAGSGSRGSRGATR